MKLFWFQRWKSFDFKELSNEVENAGFDGILFPYSSHDDDYFIPIATNIEPDKNIKYMVAIRPYTISPQYINQIVKSINKISNDRVLINFVSGWVYENEKNLGGIHGDINNLSSNIDRSNYLADYIDVVNNMKRNKINFYVSVTNSVMLEKTKNNKVIIPYIWYKQGKFDLSGVTAMISICPIIRKTKEEIDKIKNNSESQESVYFTEDEFMKFLNDINEKNIDGLLIFEDSENIEKENIMKIINKAQHFLKEKK
jgi:alkanesulfonate monooxygenase SsuD/methylene tetrahydromethanopterin reductase-like flavin-dependent oxidoreductase (luciferase family)